LQALARRDPEMLVWWGSEVECVSALSRLERAAALDAKGIALASRRLTRDYLFRLAEEAAFSDAILHYIWDGQLPRENQTKPSGTDRLFEAYKSFRFRLSNLWRSNFYYEHRQACDRGYSRAVQVVKSGNPATKPH